MRSCDALLATVAVSSGLLGATARADELAGSGAVLRFSLDAQDAPFDSSTHRWPLPRRQTLGASAWAGQGPLLLGLGVETLRTAAEPSATSLMAAANVAHPLRDGGLTTAYPVFSLRLALPERGDLSLDYRRPPPEGWVGNARARDGGELGIRFRPAFSSLGPALRARALRWQLDSDSSISLRSSRRGLSLQYRADFDF